MGTCISTIHKNTSSAKVQMSQDNNSSSIPPTPDKHKHKPPPVTTTILPPVDPPPIISTSFKSRVSPFHSISSYRSNHGSREEAFYDTQGWLESDCEDDFYSVNGDFTPSRGNTPVHPSIGTPRLHKTFSPQVNKAVFDVRLSSASLRSRGSTPVRRSFSSAPGVTGNLPEGATGISQEPALKPKKKKLADLFRESMRERGGFGLSFPGYESDGSQRIGTSPNNPALPPKPRKGTSPLSGPRSVSPPNNYVLEKDKSSRFSQRCFPRLVSIRSFNESKKTSSRASSVEDLEKFPQR
ncbi:uncharacterized protein LOC141611900 [Silene latifolia]|uniref:uncharacterized protein LOC141611900 n=1 Tax=Silene latifolia TaxID=37657 RepID=UPI003D76A5C6